MGSATEMVCTRGLGARFGAVVAVDDLNLSIGAGEIFGLIGRNGAGKTTTIKMLTTLLPPSAGTASIAGLDVVKQASSVRRLIGYVPQALSADGELTGYENLLVFARLFDVPRASLKARIDAALSFMGLADSAHKLVRSYSGGMIRRLEIAQSTLHRPRVLFLDEPTIGLDPVAREAVWEHIARLNTEAGTTMVITTHYLEEAEALCQRIGIMHLGRLVALDTPGQLKAQAGADTLDEAFVRLTGGPAERDAGYVDTSRTRRAAGRLG